MPGKPRGGVNTREAGKGVFWEAGTGGVLGRKGCKNYMLGGFSRWDKAMPQIRETVKESFYSVSQVDYCRWEIRAG